MLIINADDWGKNELTTNNILHCFKMRRINSASGMVFMTDSERAALLARQSGLPVGLHLNFMQRLTGKKVSSRLIDQHNKIVNYLNARKFNQIIFNPLLHSAFDFVCKAQWDEFCRIYEKEPERLDGHHHMHLCMNMLLCFRLPEGIKIRRNFTFGSGEKSIINRFYRYVVDSFLNARFKCTDAFFSLSPIDNKKIQQIIILSRSYDVELMVHPERKEEYLYLLGREWADLILSSY